MNEELQSTNEELQTVNEELRQRTDESNRLNAFLESVLGSMRSGAAVLNKDIAVLMWNKRAEDLWGLRPDEAEGRSLFSLDIGLPLEPLRNVIRPCLSGEADHQEIVLDAVNRRGKTIRCQITCSPLIADGMRDGVILLMEEVAAS
jgi:two-component system CheB/CheR fusion protein